MEQRGSHKWGIQSVINICPILWNKRNNWTGENISGFRQLSIPTPSFLCEYFLFPSWERRFPENRNNYMAWNVSLNELQHVRELLELHDWSVTLTWIVSNLCQLSICIKYNVSLISYILIPKATPYKNYNKFGTQVNLFIIVKCKLETTQTFFDFLRRETYRRKKPPLSSSIPYPN